MSDGAESPSVTHLLGASGACPEITLNGKVWRVGHPTQKAKATLETLAVAQATAEVEELEGNLPPDRYKKLFNRLVDNITAKHYKTWGEGWQQVVWGPQSTHLFFLSLLRENHPEATEADARAIMEGAPGQVATALAQLIPPFLSLLLNDHKGLTPEQRAQFMGVVMEKMAALGMTPPLPAPTPSTSAPLSDSGVKPSRRNRGVSTRTRLPA